jgi:antitoxin (DNA-binding transcriptional repressor) of toxin-antitoxin stability system
MSNHAHPIVRIDRDRALGWSVEEVLKRWTALFAGPLPVKRYLSEQRSTMTAAEIETVHEMAEVYRARLYDLSWLMRTLNEDIARRANAEDGVKGRCREGRFKSQALLDEAALLAALAYVDLNPVRAGIAETPESSDYTSIQERIRALSTSRDEGEPQAPVEPVGAEAGGGGARLSSGSLDALRCDRPHAVGDSLRFPRLSGAGRLDRQGRAAGQAGLHPRVDPEAADATGDRSGRLRRVRCPDAEGVRNGGGGAPGADGVVRQAPIPVPVGVAGGAPDVSRGPGRLSRRGSGRGMGRHLGCTSYKQLIPSATETPDKVPRADRKSPSSGLFLPKKCAATRTGIQRARAVQQAGEKAMVLQIPLEKAQRQLPELVKRLGDGDEVVITDHDRPVARLLQPPSVAHRRRVPGSAKGKLHILVDDDAHLEDFRDYMPWGRYSIPTPSCGSSWMTRGFLRSQPT